MNYNFNDKHFVGTILIVAFVLLIVWYFLKDCIVKENFPYQTAHPYYQNQPYAGNYYYNNAGRLIWGV